MKKIDSKSFKEVYDSYWPILYLHAYKMLRDKDEAKDLLQDLFIHVWENKSEIRFDQIRPYLYVSLRNRIINRYAHTKVKNKYLDKVKNLPIQDLLYNHVEEGLILKELENRIEEGVKQLPKRMQEIFRLSREEYFNHSEIAEQLNISTHTVKKTINRALKEIRKKISLVIQVFG